MFVSILQLMTLPFGKPVQSRPGPDPLSGPHEKTPQNDNRGSSRRSEVRAVPEQRLPAGAHVQAGASRRQEVKSAATKPAAKTQASAPARASKKTSPPAAKATASARTAEVKGGGKRKAEAVAKPASAKPPAKAGKAVKEKAVVRAAPPAPKAPVKAPVKPAAPPAKATNKAKVAEQGKSAKPAKPAVTSGGGSSVGAVPSKRAPVASPAKPVPAVTKSAAAPEPKPTPAAAPAAAPKPASAVTTTAPAPAPAKAGRPSRLSQITVPSMAQSVASTAAKASYTNTMSSPVLTPPTYIPARKDPKLANNWKTKSADELSDAEVLAMPDEEYMNDKQLAFFRGKLLQLKQGILSNAGETTEHLRADTVIVPDPADRATIEEEHALELRTRDRERKLLKKIEQSIARIDAGDYGYCDETGEPIGVGRLMARPTATLSLEAQQRRELKQKMFGD